MTLKQRISADHMTAFKAKDGVRKSILSVVKSEIQMAEKNTGQADLSDEDTMKILNKTVKSLNETIEKSNDEVSKLELEVLKEYMPQQMSREAVKAKIEALVEEAYIKDGTKPSIGAIMKAFALDAVDKKMVAEVFNESQKQTA